MSRSDKVRTGPCSRADAVGRLKQAQASVMVSELCLADDTSVATPGVAAALAVLAAIAACDAACCARLHRRARGQNHEQAVDLVATVAPDGAKMAKLLREVLAAKDDSHYGFALVSAKQAQALVRKAGMLTAWAERIVNA